MIINKSVHLRPGVIGSMVRLITHWYCRHICNSGYMYKFSHPHNWQSGATLNLPPHFSLSLMPSRRFQSCRATTLISLSVLCSTRGDWDDIKPTRFCIHKLAWPIFWGRFAASSRTHPQVFPIAPAYDARFAAAILRKYVTSHEASANFFPLTAFFSSTIY